MAVQCSYCTSLVEDDSSSCQKCGAPTGAGVTATTDFRHCPFCQRRLLALASPACSYCGRRLPEEYIEAREADLRRITEINDLRRDDRDDEHPDGRPNSPVADAVAKLLDIF